MRGGDERPFGLCLSFGEGEGKECKVSPELFESSDFGAGEACEELEITT